MEPIAYKKVKPYKELAPFIHFYWELKGSGNGFFQMAVPEC